jgi:bacillopeptidase F
MVARILGLFIGIMAFTGFAQGQKFSKKLQEEYNQMLFRSGKALDVVMVAADQPKLDSLDLALTARGASRKERGKAVVSYLVDFAENHQFKHAGSYAQDTDVRIKQSFWIVPVHRAQVTKAGLEKLLVDDNVLHIELESEQTVQGHFPLPAKGPASRSPGGVEPGLEAVNSRFLWNLGYTGRGKKILNYDTGIWPDHPTHIGRFMGDRGPLAHAWYPFDKFLPGDKGNSHGTHTNGTSVGLDTATQDTVGMAFNSYFMATDPIVSSLADVRGVAELMSGYQWAMDPDGNPATSDDMPDVINNSWGRPYDPADTNMCSSFVDNALLAMEVAGIVSVQSAGNAGPGAGTVGFPAGNNPTLTANFAVGAVDGNNPNFPIASFSSRGPSACGDTGSLNIKPEIVAPGVAVRSAIRDGNGNYTYDFYQGTSMAGPHAAGIALLLMEAFPQASAQEIKMAMYLSATDLGVPGEDNVYGNGMLNGEAAYNHLLQTYTPATPASQTFDADVTQTSLDRADFLCLGIQPVGTVLHHRAAINTSNANLSYGVYGLDTVSHSFTQATLNGVDSLNLGSYAFTQSGWNEFFVSYTQSQEQEVDVLNNARFTQVYVLHESSLPYVEEFNQDTWLQESEVYIHDEDNIFTWDTAHVFTPSGDNRAAMIPLFDYLPRNGQRDGIISAKINLPSSGAVNLYASFDYAYQLRFVGFPDSLEMRVSTDCGTSWTSVKQWGTEELNTTDQPLGQTGFVPLTADDWRADTVDLSAFADAGEIIVKLEAINGGGNNLYVDRLQIFDDAGPVTVNEYAVETGWELFPNPAKNTVSLRVTDDSRVGSTGAVMDLKGRTVKTFTVRGEQTVISLKELPAGVYVIRFGEETAKLIVE